MWLHWTQCFKQKQKQTKNLFHIRVLTGAMHLCDECVGVLNTVSVPHSCSHKCQATVEWMCGCTEHCVCSAFLSSQVPCTCVMNVWVYWTVCLFHIPVLTSAMHLCNECVGVWNTAMHLCNECVGVLNTVSDPLSCSHKCHATVEWMYGCIEHYICSTLLFSQVPCTCVMNVWVYWTLCLFHISVLTSAMHLCNECVGVLNTVSVPHSCSHKCHAPV